MANNTIKLADFDHPQVQLVYKILCDNAEPPNNEHWEGFAARRIVAEFRPDAGGDDVREALSEARSCLCSFTGGPDGACSETISRIDAALSNPPAAVESNASVEARLREALPPLMKIVNNIAWCHDIDGLRRERDKVNAILSPAVGDEAKKSEGGATLTFVRRLVDDPNSASGKSLQDVEVRPSDPTADVRCKACSGTGRHMGRFSMNDPDCTYCNGTGLDGGKFRLRAYTTATPSDPTADVT